MNHVLLQTPVVGKDGLMTPLWIKQQIALTSTANGGLQVDNNLSDVANPAAARTNLGLDTAATLPKTTFLQAANSLSDLPTPATARTNLGLGSAAVQPVTAFDTAGAAAAAAAASLQKSANLSDLASAATACTNLGLGAGLSVTVPLAKLTTGGTNGTLTYVNGILTAVVNPT
jgi:hypothetical protein